MYVKGGCSTKEPNRIVVTDNLEANYAMNIDKGIQANSGSDAIVLGTLRAPTLGWQLKTVSNSISFTTRTDSNGSTWLLVGLDSAFEVFSEIYFTSVQAEFTEM